MEIPYGNYEIGFSIYITKLTKRWGWSKIGGLESKKIITIGLGVGGGGVGVVWGGGGGAVGAVGNYLVVIN